jgi:hypothetical protein
MTGGFGRGVFVVKPVLPVGVKNVVAFRHVVVHCFNGVRLVLEKSLCVCSHYPVLRMAQHKESSRYYPVCFSPGTM